MGLDCLMNLVDKPKTTEKHKETADPETLNSQILKEAQKAPRVSMTPPPSTPMFEPR